MAKENGVEKGHLRLSVDEIKDLEDMTSLKSSEEATGLPRMAG